MTTSRGNISEASWFDLGRFEFFKWKPWISVVFLFIYNEMYQFPKTQIFFLGNLCSSGHSAKAKKEDMGGRHTDKKGIFFLIKDN